MAIKSKKNKGSPRGVSKVLRRILDTQVVTQERQRKHEEEDVKHFTEINEALKQQPTKEDFAHLIHMLVDEDGQPKFATKTDVADVLSFWNNVKTGARFLSGGGRFGYHFFIVAITVFGGWALFTGGLKGLTIYLLSLVTK